MLSADGIEEHVSAEFFECQGWDPNRSSLYKANAMGAASTSWRPGGDPSSAAYANGWERKLPDCDNCDNGDGAAEADCSVGDENPQCNEGEWPDKDHCLVCGDCENQTALPSRHVPNAERSCLRRQSFGQQLQLAVRGHLRQLLPRARQDM